MGIDSSIFRSDYSDCSWDDLRADSMRMHGILSGMSSIHLSTPGLGLGDNFQCCTAIRTVDEIYHPDELVIECYHPYLFEGNPRCRVGTDVHSPGNLVLHTWPYRNLPNGGIQDDGTKVCSARAYDIRVGAYDRPMDTDSEFYPTTEEIIWGAMELSKYQPYITVQLRGDPPRKYYNISPVAEGSDSDARWMSATDWYTDRFEVVVDMIKSHGYGVLQIGCEYEELIPGCIDMRTVGPRRTFIVIGKADLHIGHDSFPQHVASAMDTHAIILMAGRSNNQLHSNTTRIQMSAGLECSNCLDRDEHIDTYCTRECMDLITPDMIVQASLEVLDVR